MLISTSIRVKIILINSNDLVLQWEFSEVRDVLGPLNQGGKLALGGEFEFGLKENLLFV